MPCLAARINRIIPSLHPPTVLPELSEFVFRPRETFSPCWAHFGESYTSTICTRVNSNEQFGAGASTLPSPTFRKHPRFTIKRKHRKKRKVKIQFNANQFCFIFPLSLRSPSVTCKRSFGFPVSFFFSICRRFSLIKVAVYLPLPPQPPAIPD